MESLKFFPASRWSLMAGLFTVALKRIGGAIIGNEVSPAVYQQLLEYCTLLELGMRDEPGPHRLRATHEFLRAWGILSGIVHPFENRKEVAEFLSPLIAFIRRSKEPRVLDNNELEVSALLQQYFTKLSRFDE